MAMQNGQQQGRAGQGSVGAPRRLLVWPAGVAWRGHSVPLRLRGRALTAGYLSSLVEELKASNPDFPDVSSGIYVQEVAPNSPSER